MIILSILSFKNVRQIRAIPRQQRQNLRTMRKKDFQLLRCLYARIIIYIIYNVLYCIHAIYQISTNSIQIAGQQELVLFIFTFDSLTHYMAFGVNFFIYIALSRAFRKGFQRLASKIFGKDLAFIREEEQKEQEIRNETQELEVIAAIAT